MISKMVQKVKRIADETLFHMELRANTSYANQYVVQSHFKTKHFYKTFSQNLCLPYI